MQGSKLSYGELDKRANQLAHRLVALGVGPEVPVGVMMERSLDLIVALLGVLKAGGAYVPMDPSYPVDRLALMMEDSEARFQKLQHALGQHCVHESFANAHCSRMQAPVILSQEKVFARVKVPGKAQVLLVRALSQWPVELDNRACSAVPLKHQPVWYTL